MSCPHSACRAPHRARQGVPGDSGTDLISHPVCGESVLRGESSHHVPAYRYAASAAMRATGSRGERAHYRLGGYGDAFAEVGEVLGVGFEEIIQQLAGDL